MPVSATTDQLSHGGLQYLQFCSVCHGDLASEGGVIPGLAFSSEATHKNIKRIVLEGLLYDKGMPNFSGRLKESDVSDIQNYIFYFAKNIAKEKETQATTVGKIHSKSTQ